MSTQISTKELRKMQIPELRKEIETKTLDVAKMRLNVQMRSQKDTAKYQREKRELARMITILAGLERGAAKEASPALQPTHKRSTVSAPAKPTGEIGSASISRK